MVNPNTAADQNAYSTPNACPVEGSSLWNSHPRVYIPVEENGGEAKCPYCGTMFKLL
jgi:uncharacterized Zn-finger protein